MMGNTCTSSGGNFCDGAGNCVECLKDADCTADVTKDHCDANTHACVAAQCTDNVKDGLETDKDCGGGPGSGCSPCADGLMCNGITDCGAQSYCNAGVCAAATCTDNVKDAPGGHAETDKDCGGATCRGQGHLCGNTFGCAVDGDCTSGFCNPTSSKCAAPTCSDTFQNQGETDVDCGGPNCSPCALTKHCMQTSDCAAGVCTGNVCSPAALGAACNTGADCSAGKFCTDGVCCSAASCGGCQTCAGALKQGGSNDGNCGAVINNTDPKNDCPTQNPLVCGTTGVCVGGSCALVNVGTVCQAAACDGTSPQLLESGERLRRRRAGHVHRGEPGDAGLLAVSLQGCRMPDDLHGRRRLHRWRRLCFERPLRAAAWRRRRLRRGPRLRQRPLLRHGWRCRPGDVPRRPVCRRHAGW